VQDVAPEYIAVNAPSAVPTHAVRPVEASISMLVVQVGR
jgi:hypothetical protein